MAVEPGRAAESQLQSRLHDEHYHDDEDIVTGIGELQVERLVGVTQTAKCEIGHNRIKQEVVRCPKPYFMGRLHAGHAKERSVQVQSDSLSEEPAAGDLSRSQDDRT